MTSLCRNLRAPYMCVYIYKHTYIHDVYIHICIYIDTDRQTYRQTDKKTQTQIGNTYFEASRTSLGLFGAPWQTEGSAAGFLRGRGRPAGGTLVG